MSDRLGGLGRHLATGLVATLTLWVALWSWRGFLEAPGDYLRPTLALALLVGATGGVARWARVPGLLVVLGQVVVGAVVTAALVSGSVLPGPGSGEALAERIADAVETAQSYAAPVPADAPGLDPLLVLSGLALLLLVDLLAGTARRAALAGLPLLTAIAVPVSMLGGGVPWWVFAGTAGGYLVLLALQEDEQVVRWGRALGGGRPGASGTGGPGGPGGAAEASGGSVPQAPVVGRPAAARAGAVAIGVVATGLALLVPTSVPTLGVTLLDGPFGASDDGEIELDNPMVDLRRDLKRRDDTPLVRVRTQDPERRYLRITVLNRFSLNAWTNGDRTLPDEQRASGDVPGLAGVTDTTGLTRYPWQVEVLPAFGSRWLPTPTPVTRVEAQGNWKYDTTTMDFLASSEGLDAAGLDYSLTHADLDPTAQQLATAGPSSGSVDPEFTDLPQDLPEMVSDLAAEVTQGQPTQFQQARALQQFFRTDGGFEYTLDRDDGNGGDALVEFLSETQDGRRGYCEQFASAMAVMARSLGIPARVAVGFLKPDEVEPGVFEYSSDDLHSWPELYFRGYGWVRFEPTPGDRADAAPGYTRGDVQLPQEPAQGGVGEVPLPERGGDLGALPAQGAQPEDQTASDEAGGRDASTPWGLVAAGVGGLALLGLLLALPGLLRSRRRARRWETTPAAAAAWAELRDSAVDLGVGWPAGRSPRDTAAALHPALRSGPGSAVGALDRLVRAVEEQWYAAAPDAADAGSLSSDVDLVVEALRAGVTPRRQRLARVLPASLWRPGGGADRSPDLERVG